MEQNQSGFKRFWYIWGAVIIKIVAAQVVYAVTMFVVMVNDKMKLSIEEMEAMMGSREEILKFFQEIIDGLMNYEVYLMNYAVYIEGAAALVTIPVMAWFFYKNCKRDKSEGIIQEKAALWKYAGVIVFAAALGLGLNNLILLSDLSSLSVSYEDTMEMLYQPPMAVQLAVLGVLMPLCEELVFRGVVYKRLRYQESYMSAAIYSSLVFAVMHGNLVQILYGFIMGMLFANLYERYGSVKAPVMAHIVVNILSVVATEYKVFDWLFEEPMRVGISTVLCAAIGATMYIIIQKIGSNESLTE